MNQSPFNLLILANSPGEISNWVHSIVKEFKSRKPISHVSVYITPCQYASGSEVEMANDIQGVDQVFSPKESMRTVFTFFKRKKIKNGAILFLGGDPLYPKLLSYKTGLPAFAYTEHRSFPNWGFKQVFFKHEVGDLMGDKILNYKKQPEQIYEELGVKKNKYCLFMSGSRPEHFIHLVPLLKEALDYIREIKPDFKAILSISPFIKDSVIEKLKEENDLSSFIIKKAPSLDLINISDFAVTIPGTNTAEIAYLGTPMLVIIPLNKPELLQFDGLLGLIGNLPILGKLVKKIILFILKRKKRLYAQPNLIAKKKIVPELVGILSGKEIGDKVINTKYNENKITIMKKELLLLKPTLRISQKIWDKILES